MRRSSAAIIAWASIGLSAPAVAQLSAIPPEILLTSGAYAVSAAITPTAPEEFAGLLLTDIATLKKVAKAANIRID